jgi:hypothetical protein
MLATTMQGTKVNVKTDFDVEPLRRLPASEIELGKDMLANKGATTMCWIINLCMRTQASA